MVGAFPSWVASLPFLDHVESLSIGRSLSLRGGLVLSKTRSVTSGLPSKVPELVRVQRGSQGQGSRVDLMD